MACQVVHGFGKSEQNEKLQRGDPHSRHEARRQALQQPEHSVLPFISESRHVLIVVVVSGESILGDVTAGPILSGDPVVGIHLLLGKFPPPIVLGSGFLSTS